MRSLTPLHVAVALGIAVSVACTADSPVAPTRLPPGASPAVTGGRSGSDEQTLVAPGLWAINNQLAARGANYRLAKLELRMNSRWDGLTSTIILAEDRYRGTGFEWVKGDPRRGGRIGVAYQVASGLGVTPVIIKPDRSGLTLATYALLDQQIEEGMGAWRDRTCSAAPITRVAIPAGTDPDVLDQLLALQPPNANYAQTADIVHGGWQVPQFFRNIAVLSGLAPEVGDAIIGITFGFAFTDNNGHATDIDRDGKADLGLSEIYFNALHVYDNSGILAIGPVDFFSGIAHESGHALGLGHLGKIFVTRHDAADGVVSLSQVKYAPKALMNAAYIAGRDDITGLDNSQFCEIWAGH